jgi:hypothetical protein
MQHDQSATLNLLKFVFGQPLRGPFAKLLNGDAATRAALPSWADRLDVLNVRADLSPEVNAKVSDEDLLTLLNDDDAFEAAGAEAFGDLGSFLRALEENEDLA